MKKLSFNLIELALIGLITLFIGFMFGLTATDKYWERQAVEHGHAEFYIDAEHEKQGRWKEVIVVDTNNPLSEPLRPREPQSSSALPSVEPTHRKEP